MSASNTAVRGLLSAPGSTGVAWVSTTLPVPSPVDDPYHDGAGFRAGEFGHHRDPEPADLECHGHQETIRVLGEAVVDGWCGEHIKVRE